MRGMLRTPVRVAAAFLGATLLAALPSVAATPVCVTSGPASLAYSVTACIETAAEPTAVSGDVAFSLTLTTTGVAPAVTRIDWHLGSEHLLRDIEAPYDFVLPTAKFVDGAKVLNARILMADGFLATRPELPLVFANGVTSPPVNTNTFTPASGPPDAESLVVAATGDAAGGKAMSARMAQTLTSWNPDMFLYLGDVYENGTYTEHYNHFGHGGSLFHALRNVTNPSVGNHEYTTPGAAGYFDYWDNVPHYYSVDAAGWHVVALDSTSTFGQLGTSSPQYQWLVQDLAGAEGCTLAFMHHPRFSIGGHGDYPALDDVWRALAAAGVDIMLTGHDHHYQRWAPLDANGQRSALGVTQFVAGAGGHSVRPFNRTDTRVERSLTGEDAYGALRFQLQQGGATYEYINVDGVVKDSGSIVCDPVVSPPTVSEFSFSGSGAPGAWRTHTFSIAQPGALTATLDWANSLADLNLWLYDAAGTRIGLANSTTQKPEVITRELAAGSYKFGIGFKLASTNYSLNAVVDHGTGTVTPPTASITAPSGGAVVSGTVPVRVAATSTSDPVGTLQVQVRIAGGAWQTAAYDAGTDRYEYTWDTTGTAEGQTLVEARATDSGSRTTEATDVAVTVDNLPSETTTYTFSGKGKPGAWRKHDFLVPKAGSLRATLNWNSTADLNQWLYDSTGRTLASATSTTAKPEVIVRDVAAGTHRIGIGFRLTSAAYTLSVVVTH